MLIKVEELRHTYSPNTPLERAALHGVSLEIRAGERVGLLGHTGSGKTTLMQHIAGLLTPTTGRALLDGIPAHQRSKTALALRRQIGMAFQHPEAQIFKQTVFQEVAFGPRNLGLGEDKIAERVRWALGMTGLDGEDIEKRFPFTLSGGEMRRVALASILAMRPQVLLLDEPSAGLDPQGQRELLARIRDWQAKTGSTLLLISHNLETLARVVERVIILKEGKIAADGPVRQVLSDKDSLHAAGLEVPQPVALLDKLREAGWPVRVDRLLPEETAAEIMRVKAALVRRAL